MHNTKTSSLEMRTVWVVVPGYNEARYIQTVIEKITAVTPNIIFVDDGSSDATASIARAHTQHVVVHQVNLGKGAAMKTGCEYAFGVLSAEAVILLDADDQHDPAEIPRFIEQLSTGKQMVFGVRKFSPMTMPLLRFLGNKMASALLAALYGAYIPDIPSGYKAFTRQTYQKMAWSSQGYEVETEIAVAVATQRIKYSTIEIETIYHDTQKGMNAIEALKIIQCLLFWRLGGLR